MIVRAQEKEQVGGCCVLSVVGQRDATWQATDKWSRANEENTIDIELWANLPSQHIP